MPIPPFHEFFHPFLALLVRDGTLHMRDVYARLYATSGLSAAELSQRLPSGAFTVVENRIGWARTYLFKAGLIERVTRGTYRITPAGRTMLDSRPTKVTVSDLMKIPAFAEWQARAREAAADDLTATSAAPSPSCAPGSAEEEMAAKEQQLRQLVEEDILERLIGLPWQRFEWLVEQLVVKLGYGASAAEVAGALRNTGADEGIDGVIHEDRLGLGQIYLQAKKWQATVGRPDLQKFVGAMHGRAKKGVFLTTSAFSSEATQYAKSLHDIRLRLVNGRELASLMIDCGLGVSEEQVYKTYRIDSDFFEESD